jgi:hypothetical protein
MNLTQEDLKKIKENKIIKVLNTKETYRNITIRSEVEFKNQIIIIYDTIVNDQFGMDDNVEYYIYNEHKTNEIEITEEDLKAILGEEDYDYFMDNVADKIANK